MRKPISILLALVLIFGISIPAFAADTQDITLRVSTDEGSIELFISGVNYIIYRENAIPKDVQINSIGVPVIVAGSFTHKEMMDDIVVLTKTFQAGDEVSHYYLTSANFKIDFDEYAGTRVSFTNRSEESFIYNNAESNVTLDQIGAVLASLPVERKTPNNPPSSWAAEYVDRALDLDLIPEDLQDNYTTPMTRAEFCALGVRLYESVSSEITERKTFTDTTNIDVQKLAGIGVISGVGNDKFDPDSSLTREQAAVILNRLMLKTGLNMANEGTPTFADNASISSWAIGAVGNMQELGIMSGIGNNNFSPKGTYTREQCITTILRVYDTVSFGGMGG